MLNTDKIFNAKVLLFGEYTVTLGSNALAIPHKGFRGRWDFEKNENSQAKELKKLHHHISSSPFLSSLYDCQRFLTDIHRHLTFNSSIPLGYGLGSSGALVAALYHEYAIRKPEEISEIKTILAETESAFHGSSSGLDPLVSFLNKPVLIENGITNLVNFTPKKGSFYLLDTQKSRQTGDLVHIFKHKLQTDDQFRKATLDLTALNNEVIYYCLEYNFEAIKSPLFDISKLQYLFFEPMIPDSFKKLWKSGLDSGDFLLKLCGAGGGGMMMAWINDLPNFQKNFNHKLLSIE